MNKARIGFVGCGTHSTHNLYPMLNYARATLEAVCDVDANLARRNMQMFGGKAFFTSVDEMLAKTELDGVMIVGPSQLHYEAGLKSLKRGLPTFVEKPTAPDLAKTEELVALARANHTFLMTAFMKRHGLTYGKIREFIAAGRFKPNSCFMKYMHWPMGAEGLRGMLLGMSSHPIDLVMSFFGTPRRLQCTLGKGAQGWASLGVNLTFESGRMAQLMLGSQVRIQERFEIAGVMDDSAAFFVVDNVMNLEMHKQGQGGVDVLAPSPDLIQPTFDLSDIQVWRPDYGIPNMGQTRHFVQGFAGEVREFCDAILEKRAPVPGMDETLAVMRIIEAIAANPDGTTEF
jgi:myo-inositol 2-dehydrogenase/D-chiro-inositol 1-dehydrogenase